MILDTNCEVLKASATDEMKGVVMPYVSLLFIARFVTQTGHSDLRGGECRLFSENRHFQCYDLTPPLLLSPVGT